MKFRNSSVRAALICGLAMVVGVPAMLPAAEIKVKSDTLMMGFERNTSKGNDQAVAPGYEYLQVDAGQLRQKGLSFHSYGWGRFDFADNNYFEDQSEGELLYGYLQYATPTRGFDVKLGRQNINSGISNDPIDGLKVSGDLGGGLTASAYGGQAVGYTNDNGRSGDSTYGGRLGYQQVKYGEIGLSYKKLRNDHLTVEEQMGVDLALFLPDNISLFGFSSRNLDTDGWGEHSYELRIPYKSFNFRPYFGQYNYEDYFGTTVNTVNPFRVLAINGEKLREFGLDTTWKYSDSLNFGVKLKGNDYDLMNSSEYGSGLVTWHGNDLTQVGLEVGYMHGDLDRQRYLLSRLYTYLDDLTGFGVGFVSGDVIWAHYDSPINGRDNSIFVSLGTGRNFFNKALEIKISGDYSRDPFFDSDLRGLLSVTYRYDQKI